MCGSWNTLVEVSAAPEKRSTHSAGGTSSRAVTLGSVSENDTVRVTTGIGEFDRVLGGGVVVGSTVLIGGDPGIGKSTLIMQAAGNLKKTGGVIYVSGEESKSAAEASCGALRGRFGTAHNDGNEHGCR